LSPDAVNNVKSSKTQTTRNFYNGQAKDYVTYSNISFIAAGAIYLWNLIEAITVE
jgi:hypothetical protein